MKQDKLKPSQPYFVLDTENFVQDVYLKQGISHFYSFQITDEKEIKAVPDGCIDIVFEYRDGGMRAFACGTVLKSKFQHWDSVKEVFGVRFLPGQQPAGVNVEMHELIGKRLLLDDIIENRTMLRRMSETAGFHERIRVFLDEYTKFEAQKEKPYGKMELLMSVKDMVYESDGLETVSNMSEKTGYTERYINKVFVEKMGFSPKTFCKIIQFQRALEYLNYGTPENMTKAAVDLGYYDQAKFIRDFKEYGGVTPHQYLKLIESGGYREKIRSGTSHGENR